VDGVVGEARQCVSDKIDVHFGLVCIRKRKNALGEMMHFCFGRQVRLGDGRAGDAPERRPRSMSGFPSGLHRCITPSLGKGHAHANLSKARRRRSMARAHGLLWLALAAIGRAP